MAPTSETDSVELAVIRAVADHEGTGPTELEPPLAAVIDPDAIERLVGADTAGRARDVELSFTYRGHDVAVRADGEVDVAE